MTTRQVVERNKAAYNRLLATELRSSALEHNKPASEASKSLNTQMHAYVDYAQKMVDTGFWNELDFMLAAYTAETFFPLASIWFYSIAPLRPADEQLDLVKHVLSNPRPMFEHLKTNGLFRSKLASSSTEDLVKQFKREIYSCFWTGVPVREESMWSEFELVQLFPVPGLFDVNNLALVSKAAATATKSANLYVKQQQKIGLTQNDPHAFTVSSTLKPPQPGVSYCDTVFGWLGSSPLDSGKVSEARETDSSSISLDGKVLCPRKSTHSHLAHAFVFLSDKYPDFSADLAKSVRYPNMVDWVTMPISLRSVFWYLMMVYIQKDTNPLLFVAPEMRSVAATGCIAGNLAFADQQIDGTNPFALSIDQAYEYKDLPDDSVLVLSRTETTSYRIRDRKNGQVEYSYITKNTTVDPRHLAAIERFEKANNKPAQ